MYIIKSRKSSSLLLRVFLLSMVLVFENFPTRAKALQNLNGQSQTQAQSEVEQHRKDIEEKNQKSLVLEAIEAIEDTKKAVDALSKGAENEALAAIERATGKTSLLLTRYPDKSLLPVRFEIQIIETALVKIPLIRKVRHSIKNAVEYMDYPQARLLLDTLKSEINIRIYHLPLAVYPAALQKADQLIRLKKTGEALGVLATALDTLVVLNHVLPLPILHAKGFLKSAEERYQKEKDVGLKLLRRSRYELRLAKELGYTGLSLDAEYAALSKSIEDLEAQIKGDKNGVSGIFSSIKDKLKTFLDRLSRVKKDSLYP